MLVIVLLLTTLLLAYSNGANDNFKGVATLYGGGVLSYRAARWLSTAATLAGALAAILLAQGLIKAFSGRGLVPDAVAANPAFAAAVALAAGGTVALATRLALPVSTTHALVGSLVGAGWLAAGDALALKALANQFVMPLLLGPLAAFGLVALVARIRVVKVPQQAQSDACVCIGPAQPALHAVASGAAAFNPSATTPVVVGTTTGACAEQANTAGVTMLTTSRAADAAHIASGVTVCFARGLNDAPKIAALMLLANTGGVPQSLALVGIAMALGGFFHSQRIAQTMSHRIVSLGPRSGLLANLCTSGLVIAASKYGLPLSTTHVSVGAIAGLGTAGARLSGDTLRNIVLSWVATLPCAALLSGITYLIFSSLLT